MYNFPSKKNTAKSRVMSKLGYTLDEVSKNTHEARFDVVVEKKIIDGNPVSTARLCYYPGGPSPMRQEYTDIEQFSNDLKSLISEVAKKL